MATKKSYEQILNDLIEDFIPAIRDAFLTSIAGVVDNVILKDMIDAIQEGDVEKAFRVLGISDAVMRPITAALEQAFEKGGVAVGGTFPKVLNTPAGRAVFRFDVRNSRAEAIVRDQSSKLVTKVSDDTRVVLRNAMFEGLKQGDNPRRTSLDLIGRINPTTGKREGGLIGLTPRQERWVASTRRELQELDDAYFSRDLRNKRFDPIVRKAIREGKPLTSDEVSKITTAYKNNTLRYRGNTIARTEAIASLNASEYEATLQAADMGAVKESATKRVWDSAGNDGRTRKTHLQMEGQTVGLREAFTFPGGGKAMFPGDTSMGAPAEETVQCRCRTRLKIDWLADLD